MSAPKGVWIGSGVRYDNIPVGGLAIDPGTTKAFVSYPSISLVKILNLNSGTFYSEFNPGFKSPPAQSGLAISPDGTLFSENAASNDSYGGKIFSYQANTYARSHVGMTNYYSFPLGYAKPASVVAMAYTPDNQLVVLDLVDQTLKKVDVSASYDPYRRVGQPVLSGDILNGVSPKSDVVTSYLGTTLITTDDNVINFNPLTSQAVKLFNSGSSPLIQARSVATDRKHTLYLAGEFKRPGQANVEGILVLPKLEQESWSSYIDIDGCRLDRQLVVRDLFDVTHVRVSLDGDRLVYLDTGGTPRIRGFGVSGRVIKNDGTPVQGATVAVGGIYGPSAVPQKTNSCGTFHFLNSLSSSSNQTTLELTISHPDLGTQRQLVIMDSAGQSFRDILLEPPVINQNDPTKTLSIRPFNLPRTPFTLAVGNPSTLGGFAFIEMSVEADLKFIPSPPNPLRPASADSLNIISPVNRTKTAASRIDVQGVVDDERIASVTLTVNSVPQAVPVLNRLFNATIDLIPGTNLILAQAAFAVSGQTFTSYAPTVIVESIPNYQGAGTVAGVIRDTTTGELLSDVNLQLQSGESTTTDGRGAYYFKNISMGENSIEVVIPDGDPVPDPPQGAP